MEIPLIAQVFAELADGRFHSGEALAGTLGVSRSAVWKAAAALKALGSELHAVRNRGYRLARAAEPLDPAKIRERLAREARERIKRVDVAWSIDSTNTALLARANPAAGVAEVLLAEYQTAGRGRRGRLWLAPPGGALCLSMSWTFGEVPQELGALGLAIGVCALRALRAHGIEAVTLKWPNDLLIGERKLGGVLIDLRAESAGPASVVIGIGINLTLGAVLIAHIAQSGTAATDLASVLQPLPGRNALAATLVSACVGGLRTFAREGLKPFIEDWRAVDALRGRAVNVSAADGVTRGVARGIDLRGALMLETPQGLRRFISGDVTLRL
ncbi:MAG TPA: biotin--[acetyl-CoA-carboxylase] ligase [Steroidobacteraceae bacterium]|jgi:BirA family biotin operon repressor/biotin-[acetyl-CoA-carboxylase] ligase|nr:biotin--[acetyl-CoA-carboxylase] ligase [Steroidobacteraceae bacterium]